MQSFDQSVSLYFDRPAYPAKRNPKPLRSDSNDVAAYAI